ncbi:MAG TPA: DUF5752 family protein [Terriglobia bacterium]|nr:DUF5752 family protein [Terriglobia bacterium]
MKTADQPFQFYTASDLVRICNQNAANLAELRDALEQCSDASMFYHTFQSLGRHHFLTERFSNDFAQWVLAACNRAELAERLACVDIREYVSIVELRTDLRRLVVEYCDAEPQFATQAAFEPFNFCESIEVTLPLGWEARTLEEFRDHLERLSHASLHFHFISSRLRLHLKTNDFSYWIATGLGLGDLAARMNRIDVYTNTLDSIQEELVRLIDQQIRN